MALAFLLANTSFAFAAVSGPLDLDCTNSDVFIDYNAKTVGWSEKSSNGLILSATIFPAKINSTVIAWGNENYNFSLDLVELRIRAQKLSPTGKPSSWEEVCNVVPAPEKKF